jgi:ATP-dependent DNA ligase
MTRDRTQAAEWLKRFEGAGLDGVIAKPADLPYTPGKRAMFKIKHARTAECVVAGFRWYKDTDDAVGSLLLGLYDNKGVLHHVGRDVLLYHAEAQGAGARARATADKRARVTSLARVGNGAGPRAAHPGGQSRWAQGKDLSWSRCASNASAR